MLATLLINHIPNFKMVSLNSERTFNVPTLATVSSVQQFHCQCAWALIYIPLSLQELAHYITAYCSSPFAIFPMSLACNNAWMQASLWLPRFTCLLKQIMQSFVHLFSFWMIKWMLPSFSMPFTLVIYYHSGNGLPYRGQSRDVNFCTMQRSYCLLVSFFL